MVHKPPPFAPSEVQEIVCECLEDSNRRFLERGTTQNYLELWGIDRDYFYEELVAELKRYHLYIKPVDQGKSLKYQYVIPWDEELLVHVTVSPNGEPPKVKLSLHPHNTGHAPLSRVLIDSEQEKANEETRKSE